MTNKESIIPKGLSIDWIKYFVVFSETLNTTKASETLCITRQALIKSIKGLEAHFNTSLVQKKRYFVGLTTDGQIFLEKAIKILQNIYDLENHFNDVDSVDNTKSITIASATLHAYDKMFPQALSEFMFRYPATYLKMYNMPNNEVQKKLLNGDIDIGLLEFVDPDLKSSDLEYIEIETVNYIIVGKPSKKQKYNDLPYILPGFFSTMVENDLVLKKSNEKNITIIGETNSISRALDLCETGVCFSFVPEIVARDRIEQGKLVIVPNSPFKNTITTFIAVNKNIHLSKTCHELIKILKKHLLRV